MKTKTWLPIFPGFYNTIYEPDEKDEIASINDERTSKNLSPLPYDAFKFNYDDYCEEVARGCVSYFEDKMKPYITKAMFESVKSPKEYNFANDSIHIEVTLSADNIKLIRKFLHENYTEFKQYIKDRYTSCSGFISSYSNDAEDWMSNEDLKHTHKLGQILQFIILNDESLDISGDVYDDMYYKATEQIYLSAENYDDCITKEYCQACNEFFAPTNKGNICPDCYESKINDLDIIVCGHCGQQITNKWFVRSILHQIKHGLIKAGEIRCDLHSIA